MAFKMRNPFKQTQYETELNVPTKKEDALGSNLDEEYKKLVEASKERALTATELENFKQLEKQLSEVSRSRRKNVKAHGTYKEYLEDVEGGEGTLTRKDWIELNKENIKGA